jgi:hypothetical protein
MSSDALHARAPAACVAVNHWLYARGFKSAARLPLPDFLGIGAQKAGTTWLHANLKAHPEIVLPPEAKEVHFFDKHLLDYGLEGYSTLFRAGPGKVKGELTPAYGIIPPRRIRFVRAVLPNVKLIFLMRNPIDRAWSHALMNLVTEPNRPLHEIPDEKFIAHFKSPASRSRGDYQAILDNWLACYPRKQLFIGLFDDLTMRPRHLLTEIFSFLGISTTVDFSRFPCDQPIFKGPDTPLPVHFSRLLRQIYETPIRRLAEHYSAPADRWLADYLPGVSEC